MRDLLRNWALTVRAAGACADDAAIGAAGVDLLDRWQEPHRHYHNAEHLREVLEAIDHLTVDGVADVPVVRLAAWFHDAIHIGIPGNDEEGSAVLAQTVLAGLLVPDARIVAVGRLIQMTANHTPTEGDREAAVLCDADLAILAADPPRYARYTRTVRAEYAHVSDAAFRPGRAAVLRALLTATPLYRTARAQERWEAAARANINTELKGLESR